MKARESQDLAAIRWSKLALLQEHYRDFRDFLEDGMVELGFHATAVQHEIGMWMVHGPQYLMVQAQRGQAKTTVAALFAVWSLVHSPAHRVLIISAGGTQAVEISTLIVRLILSMEELECLRPDKLVGDRTSVENFDVHHSLKGLDKSPSVACVGIDSNLQGKRADLLIPDDIESSKNSATPVQRAKLLHLTKDFTSINSTGRIIWLGTPQTLESIYNSLPARGVHIRIWPGRYPTEKQRLFYGANLAPSIVASLARDPRLATGGGLLGDQGRPVDTVILGEEQLQKKERDQGEAYFQLQHMLNTTLADSQRFPLKPEKLVVMRGDLVRAPMTITRGVMSSHYEDRQIHDFAYKTATPLEVSPEMAKFQSLVGYVDPAAGGANADETAWAIGGFLNGNIHLVSAGGMPGGYEHEKLNALAEVFARFPNLDCIKIEKNMGYGAFREIWMPILRQKVHCQIEDDMVSGQKEARIIATLAPIMGRGSLIVDEEVFEEDRRTSAGYTPGLRQAYSLFYQLAKMTQVRDALIHDDRVDALEGLCRHFQEALAKDQQKALESQRAREWAERIKDPCGHQRYSRSPVASSSMLRRKR